MHVFLLPHLSILIINQRFRSLNEFCVYFYCRIKKGPRADNWKPIEERILIEIVTIDSNGFIQSLNDTM